MTYIRFLTPEDAPRFSEVRLRSVQEEPLAFGSNEEDEKKHLVDVAERLRSREGGFILGAFEEEELIGLTGLKQMDSLKFRHRSTLWGVYVVPEHRGRGIAGMLVAEAIRCASHMEGLEIISLRVNADNQTACRLYTSLGFESYGTEQRAMKVGDRYVDFDCMQIILNGAM